MAGNITELKRDEMTLVTEDKKEIQVRNFHLTFSTNYYTQTKKDSGQLKLKPLKNAPSRRNTAAGILKTAIMTALIQPPEVH